MALCKLNHSVRLKTHKLKQSACWCRKAPLLNLSIEDAREVVNYMRPLRIAAGEVLIREGKTDNTDYITLVHDGEVSVELAVASLQDAMTVIVLGPGSLIGDVSF